MTGIVAAGAYVPRTRLPLALIQGRKPKDDGPEKAVAYGDEDAVTLAVAAALDALAGFDRAKVDALYFASTSYELREKQGAALVAKALDLRRDVLTSDFSGSLRAGTAALEAALHAVKAGAVRTALVVASDCRMGAPRGALEAKLGDGAAAFLVGEDGVIARFEGSAAQADELQDQWRIDGERFTHTWEDRFVVEEGVVPNLVAVLRALFEKLGRKGADFARAAVYAHDARSHAGVAKQVGIAREALVDPLIGKLGNTGAAYAPMLLVSALEQARPGERIVCASYGDGAHALAFETTAAIEKEGPHLGVAGHLARRRALGSYDAYLRARHLDPQEWEGGADLGLSATVRFRDRDADIAFLGARCTQCGQIHLPRPRVCIRCRAKDQFEAVRLSDKQGRVLSYTFDYFFPAAEPPTVVVMTEVEGCRVQVQLANARPDEVRLDMPVAFVFRKIHEAGGKANYFWKASPVAEGAPT
ncbi:MAG TPA: OB-fold domain-containing protein [Myxococcota bacterium]|nr:OB-fold domain-containing protein [Myxococcota bacterium]